MYDARREVVRLHDTDEVGIVVQSNAYYSVVEFYSDGHSWRVDVGADDYDIIGYYEDGIGYKEIT